MTKTIRSYKHLQTTLQRLLVAGSSLALLSGCGMKLPEAKPTASQNTVLADTEVKFAEDYFTPVERIPVPASSLGATVERPPIPERIRRHRVDVQFPANHDANLSSLVQALSFSGIQVAFQWSNPTQKEDILERKLPFLNYQGTVGGLLPALESGMGLVAWYDKGMIYLSDKQRYSVSLPQNKEVLEAVSGEIEKLGATDIVTSIRAGKIFYTASPSTQNDVLDKFLKKLSKDLSVVTLQVAVVSLQVDDKSEMGFDWDKFKIAFDSTKTGIGATAGSDSTDNTDDSTDTDTSTDNTSTGTTTKDSSLIGEKGVTSSLSSSGISFGRTSLGKVFGRYGALSVGGAVKFLSTFGSTNVTQHVSLKTLSGSKVSLQSGQEVPYVSGVSATSNDGSTTGSTDIETVDTGLKLEMNPFWDNDKGIVTVDVTMELNSILQYVELNAGKDIGTLTQPIVQKQNMSDLVQLQAGKTVVIGGLQYNSEDKSSTEPTALRGVSEKSGVTLGAKSRETQRNALFIILRPTVTEYYSE